MICRPSGIRRAFVALPLLLFVACGGSNPANPGPSPTPAPTPTPAPQPTPTPAPTPAPTPSPAPQPTPTPCSQGLCEEPTVNTNPVESVIYRLYLVLDSGLSPRYDWTAAQAIPVGWTIRVDVTGKDGYFKDTNGNQGVRITYHYEDPSMIQEGTDSHAWQRKLLIRKPGRFRAWVFFDGVRSNELDLLFVR